MGGNKGWSPKADAAHVGEVLVYETGPAKPHRGAERRRGGLAGVLQRNRTNEMCICRKDLF